MNPNHCFSWLTRFFIACISFLSFGWVSLQAFSFIPLSLAAIGLPFLSRVASSAKGGVKKTLENVDDVVIYIKLFLLVATVLLLIIFMVWMMRAMKRRKRRKKLHGVVGLLHRVQSDLVFLCGVVAQNGETALAPAVVTELESSKKEAVALLQKKLRTRFFRKMLGMHAHRRMKQALPLLEKNLMNQTSQAVLIEQWLKTFDFLCR